MDLNCASGGMFLSEVRHSLNAWELENLNTNVWYKNRPTVHVLDNFNVLSSNLFDI